MHRPLLIVALAVLAGLLVAVPAGAARVGPFGDYGLHVYNVLPPGESGSVPAKPTSTDQIALYDGLTPLYDQIKAGDIRRFFKPARFGSPHQRGRVEKAPRKGLRIVRDSHNVPHIFGRTRDDVEFGAGWVTAEDRGLFIETIRGPARVAALDVPGLNAFSLGLSLRQFIPSGQTESFLRKQVDLLRHKGRKGRRILRDFQLYIDGINAYYRKTHNTAKPWTREDVVAVTSLIGAVFGKGGGNEVRSSQFLAALEQRLGSDAGLRVWRDLKEVNDPEAPTTVRHRFNYHGSPSGPTPGSPLVDPGSLSAAAARAAAVSTQSRRFMSNALLLGRSRSATGHPIAVMGPQVGYYYPQFLMELDLHGGGINARGAAFPGVSAYVLLGRAKDYAWSATSAGSDNIDQYLDELCNPDGSPATRDSTSYLYKGKCRPMTTFDAGLLRGTSTQPDQEVTFKQTVHGPVSGTVTVQGKPYAVTLKRSTRGRETLNALAFADLNTNRVHSARDFAKVMNQIEYTFNWFYVDNRDIAYFSSGRLPIRAPGVDPSLPTLGTGQYEWRGFLSRRAHPPAIDPPGGMLLSWNNKPAPGFGAADDEFSYGSVQRVELFRKFKRRSRLQDLVAVMNRAATEDLRAVDVWPVIADVLKGGPAPDARSQQAADLVTAWVANGASRLDRDLDGKVDDPGAAVLDAAWKRIADTVLSPVLGPQLPDFIRLDVEDDPAASDGSSYGHGWYGYVDKDLRSLLGRPVRGAYSRHYCGDGDLNACRASLWRAIQDTADSLAASQGTDPSAWRSDANAERIVFQPGLLGAANTMRWTNRPTFQQVVEFGGHRPR